jgi:hypothetical protein
LVDENILRLNYFRFLETGQREYLRNFRASSKVAGYNRNQLSDMINKFNRRYNGNRTPEINNRMKDAMKYINLSPELALSGIKAAVFRLKWQLIGLF